MFGLMRCMLPMASANQSAGTRKLSSVVKREVLISQSSNIISNTALEDWSLNNVNLKEKSLLILSNNFTGNEQTKIKATFLHDQVLWHIDAFEKIIDFSLDQMHLSPLKHSCQEHDPTSCSYSIHLQLNNNNNNNRDVSENQIFSLLENIGWLFLAEGQNQDFDDYPHHLSLVRPDDGWFPGLEQIRNKLQEDLLHIGLLHLNNKKSHSSDFEKKLLEIETNQDNLKPDSQLYSSQI